MSFLTKSYITLPSQQTLALSERLKMYGFFHFFSVIANTVIVINLIICDKSMLGMNAELKD